MTAINIIRTDETVHLFADTLANLSGAPAGQMVKCLPVPHLSAAVATRGDASTLSAIHRTVSQYPTYDEMRAGIIDAMQELARRTPYENEKRSLAQPWDAFIIGRHHGAPDAFAFFNHSLHGISAWSLFVIESVCCTPTLPTPIIEKALEGDDLLLKAMSVLDLQHHAYPSIVGGHMIETWIDPVGVHTRHLMKFPGMKISSPPPATREVKLPSAFARYQTGGAR